MVDVVDITLHTSSFPATYVGPGTLIGNPYQTADVPERINLKVTSAGNPILVHFGFFATSIKVINSTDGIVWEWQYGMPAANSIKTTLGGSFASVQDTTSQLLLTGGQASQSPGNFTLTLGATLAGTGKNLCVQIEG